MTTAAHQFDVTRALDIPPTVHLGARVEHILVDEPGLLSQTIADALSLPQVWESHACPVHTHARSAVWRHGV